MVGEVWADVESLEVNGRNIAPRYQVSTMGRVRTREESHAWPDGFLLKLKPLQKGARVVLAMDRGEPAAVLLSDVVRSVWPYLFPDLSMSSIQHLNDISSTENRQITNVWRAEKRRQKLMRRKLRAAQDRESVAAETYLSQVVDPWAAGKIRHGWQARTPDPQLGF